MTLPDDADSGETDSLTTDSNDTSDEPLASPDREVEVVELDTLSTESDELVKQVATAIKMINAIDNLEPDDTRRTKYLATTYRNIALAAELATSNGPKLQALAQTVKQSKSLADFETAAADWIDASTRSNAGALIIGEVDGNRVSLKSGTSIAVPGPERLPTSGRVIALGKLSDNQTVQALLVDSL